MVTKINRYNKNEIIEWNWSTEHELLQRPFWTSCYLIDGLLIDTGAPGGITELREFIKSQQDRQKIEKCVLTHAHEDHAGGAHIIKEELGIPVYASKKSLPILRTGYDYPEYRQITWGSKLLPVEAELLTEPIVTSSKGYVFEILPMPGHAPDLIALIEKQQQWAFVADAVQPKYKMIFGKTSSIQEDISEIYHSIQNLHEFTEGMKNLQIFVSGHGVFRGRETLTTRLTEIDTLHKTAHEFYNQGLEEEQILEKMFNGESIFAALTQGELSRINLVHSLLKWPLE